MFEIRVQRTFEATHALRNYRGGDEPPHAHRFRCEATIASPTLDGAGCAIDFTDVDLAFDRAVAPLANRPLHDLPPFADASPSAENIARLLYRTLSAALDDSTRHVTRVTVWEDDNHSAAYFE